MFFLSCILCIDLNECESNPCSQECANVYGSYQCYCRRGYQLSDIDGMTCEGKMNLFYQTHKGVYKYLDKSVSLLPCNFL